MVIRIKPKNPQKEHSVKSLSTEFGGTPQIKDGRVGDAVDMWALSSHLLVRSWSAQSCDLHYSRYLYCTTLTLAHLVKIQQNSMRFSFLSFFFPVENSISHNPQAHSQYKTVLSSIRSIIHQCCESGTGKDVFLRNSLGKSAENAFKSM